MRVPAPALERARSTYWSGLQRLWWLRARWLTLRVRAVARLRHARVEVAIGPEVSLGRRIRVEIEPGTSNVLELAPASRLQDDVLIWLRGGTLRLGRQSVLRRGVRTDTSGELTIGDRAGVSFGAVLHCAERLEIGDHTIVSEYVSITDSVHEHRPGTPIWDSVTASPTVIGSNVWIGASALVAHGVTVGDGAVIAAHSMVVRDVPAGWIVAGSPARPVREVGVERPADPT